MVTTTNNMNVAKISLRSSSFSDFIASQVCERSCSRTMCNENSNILNETKHKNLKCLQSLLAPWLTSSNQFHFLSSTFRATFDGNIFWFFFGESVIKVIALEGMLSLPESVIHLEHVFFRLMERSREFTIWALLRRLSRPVIKIQYFSLVRTLTQWFAFSFNDAAERMAFEIKQFS